MKNITFYDRNVTVRCHDDKLLHSSNKTESLWVRSDNTMRESARERQRDTNEEMEAVNEEFRKKNPGAEMNEDHSTSTY